MATTRSAEGQINGLHTQPLLNLASRSSYISSVFHLNLFSVSVLLLLTLHPVPHSSPHHPMPRINFSQTPNHTSTYFGSFQG